MFSDKRLPISPAIFSWRVTGRSEGTWRELGLSDETSLGAGRGEKRNILSFRLLAQNELLLFNYSGFRCFFLRFFENRVAERLTRNHFPLHTLLPPQPPNQNPK